MRRWVCWMLALAMLGCAATARADGLRHRVQGDVSRIEVSGQRSNASVQGGEAKLGTDVYLFVDPSTASDITFRVIDDEGAAVPGAPIYIRYAGATELYGTSGADGRCGMYLFRNETYGYRVAKGGYLTAAGTFKAMAATKTVTVVLRKLHTLSVQVVNGEAPVRGISVRASGHLTATDAGGWARMRLPNGRVDVTVALQSGRKLTVPVQVRGDTSVVVDIAAGDGLQDDGLGVYQDRFLVLNGQRAPQHYALTEFQYGAADIARRAGETDAAYAARVARYLAQNPNRVLIEAQPDADGVWSARSLVLPGELLQRFAAQGHQLLSYACGPISVTVPIEALRCPEIVKLLAGTPFADALFELLVVPVDRAALRAMIAGGEAAAPDGEIVLTSEDDAQALLRQREADGLLSAEEGAALRGLIVDDRLSEGELEALRSDRAASRLSDVMLDALIDAALAGQMRRVQWLCGVGEESVDVTQYLTDMRVDWDAEPLIQAGLTEADLAQLVLVTVSGGETARHPLALVNDKLDPKGEFYEVLLAKRMRRVTVRVTAVSQMTDGETVNRYRADPEVGEVVLPTEDARRLTAQANVSGLYGLLRPNQNGTNDAREKTDESK